MPPNPNTSPLSLSILPNDQLLYSGDRITLVLRPITTSSGQPATREVALHPGAVIILPLLPDGRIVLIRNHRHTLNLELLELPAGTLEHTPPWHGSPDPCSTMESPALAAARELTEETGYTATHITPLGWFFTSPGILTEKMYAFLATGLKKGQQSLEDNEQITPYPVTKEEALNLIAQNLIVDAKTIATLLKYFMTLAP